MIDAQELGTRLRAAERDLFRLEAQDRYEVPTDGGDFHRYLAGEAAAERTAAIYRAVDVPVLVLQPKTGRGIAELRDQIASRHALLVGNSGVGKSSIYRALGGIGVVAVPVQARLDSISLQRHASEHP